MITISQITSAPHSYTIFCCDEYFLYLLSLQLSNMPYSLIDNGLHAFYYVPMTYLFYNQKFIPLDPFPHFSHPSATTSSNHQSVLCIYKPVYFVLQIPHIREIILYLFVLLYLTYLPQHNAFKVHPCICKWQDFLLFYDLQNKNKNKNFTVDACSTLGHTFSLQINFLKNPPVHPSAVFSCAPNIPLSKVTNGFLVFDLRDNFIYLFILSLLVIKKGIGKQLLQLSSFYG